MTRAALALLLLLACRVHPARAAGDYCAFGHGTTLLLIDRTTAFDQTDRTLFLQALDSILDALGPGDRLTLYTMTGAYTESRKLFDQCKPGCPDQGFLAELLSTCRPILARSEARSFRLALATTLAGLLTKPDETRFSDLFRTVAEAVAATRRSNQTLQTVILFSDLIENSTLLPERDLKRLPPADSVARLRTNGVTAELAGAGARVFGFGRDDAPGRPPLDQKIRERIAEVWRLWLQANGAGTVEIGLR